MAASRRYLGFRRVLAIIVSTCPLAARGVRAALPMRVRLPTVGPRMLPTRVQHWPRACPRCLPRVQQRVSVLMDGSANGPARPARRWVENVPNALSLSRIAFIPVVCAIWLSALPHRAAWCSSLFGVATLTDLFDGLIARRLGCTSRFGAFLDPVTDKLLVCSCLVLLASTSRSVAFTACAIAAVAREIAVSALREWMAQCSKRDDVQVGTLGKWKTATQLAAIWLFFALPAVPTATLWGSLLPALANALLCTSTVLSTASACIYFRAASPLLFE